MSLPTSWRQFQLFDFVPIKDPASGGHELLTSDPALLALCALKDYFVVCTKHASIKLMTPDLNLLKVFQGYDVDYSINFAASVGNFLLTLAERQGSPAILKVWDIPKILKLEVDDDDYQHKFHTQLLVHNGDNSYPVSTWVFNPLLTCVALGYTNGKVVLVRGDLLGDRGSKQRIIYESTDPITGLHFNQNQDLLFVTTTSKILTVLTSGRNQGKPHRILSKSTGVDLHCSAAAGDELLIGLPDSFRYYSAVGRSHTIHFELPKRRLHLLSEHFLLVVLSFDEVLNNTKKHVTKVVVLDLRNKHISFTLTIPNSSIVDYFRWNNHVHLLGLDGVLYRITEKPINTQIELILQRELFSVALELAQQAELPPKTLLRIERLRGDHHYSKQAYDESIDSFVRCLALLKESSPDDIDDFIIDTITKFKDVSNIANLTKFLYHVYKAQLAKSDYLTLLLCCYCKLKMVDELDDFINELDVDTDPDSHVSYQLVINLFKECGYFKQVIRLLLKLKQPNHIVEIQLSDLNQPRQVLQYIRSLAIDELLLILIDHSKTLLDVLPIDTTELLIDVFTGRYQPRPDPHVFDDIEPPQAAAEPAPSALNSYQAFLSYISPEDTEQEPTQPTYLPPKPKLVFPCFADRPKEFVIFLEACIESFEKYQGNIADKRELLVTLLEMYLQLGQDGELYWREKAEALVKEHTALFDMQSLLLILHIYGFEAGELVALEEGGNFEESLFRSAAVDRDIPKCWTIVEKYGPAQPHLWKLMLKFVISEEHIYHQVEESDFRRLVQKLKDLRLMTPLELVVTLSEQPFVTIGPVKDYLIEHLDLQSKEITKNTRLVQSYELESTKISHKLTELVKKPFIMQNNKCLHCQLRLDYPVIHFKCKHLYHQRCLNENNYVSDNINSVGVKRCPECIGELDAIEAVRVAQLASKNNEAVFEGQLREAEDRFRVVFDYLGKGVMEDEVVVLE